MTESITLIAESMGISTALLAIYLVWSLVWKGFAWWKSARKGHRIWFILFFIIHTGGIFEILYIFLFSDLRLDGKKIKKVKKRRR